MSARSVLMAALTEALRGAAGLDGVAVFDAPPVRAAVPHAVIEEPVLTDWSTKDWQGREARVGLALIDAGERPVRLRAMQDAAEAAVLAVGGTHEGWRIVTVAPLRSRVLPAGAARWRAASEFRVRMVREG